MNKRDRRLLMAWVAGELDEEQAARLKRRLEHDSEMMRVHRSLLSTWNRLGEGAKHWEAETPDFVPRVMDAVRYAEGERWMLSLRTSPLWVRTAAAVALALGIGLGALIGNSANLGSGSVESAANNSMVSAETKVAVSDSGVSTLAEDYWQALIEDSGSQSGSTGANRGEK